MADQHYGITLRDERVKLGLSAKKLALLADVETGRASSTLNGTWAGVSSWSVRPFDSLKVGRRSRHSLMRSIATRKPVVRLRRASGISRRWG